MGKVGFYQTPEWKALRRQVVKGWKARGLPCSYCGQPIDWAQRWAAIVDHVEPLRKAPALALEESNLVCMHYACHNKKTAWQDLNKKPEVNAEGYPVGSGWE